MPATARAVKLHLGAFETRGRDHTDTSVPNGSVVLLPLHGGQYASSQPLPSNPPDAAYGLRKGDSPKAPALTAFSTLIAVG